MKTCTLYDPVTKHYLSSADYPARWSPFPEFALHLDWRRVARMRRNWYYIRHCKRVRD